MPEVILFLSIIACFISILWTIIRLIRRKRVRPSLLLLLVSFVIFVASAICLPSSNSTTANDSIPSTTISSYELDELQDFYVSYPLDSTLSEALSFVESKNLPYSNVHYNGSRVIQISTEEAGTAQKYNKSNLPYIEIHFSYPKNENSINDVYEKYSFEKIRYFPREGNFTFEATPETETIYRLATDINQKMTRREQMDFYYQYKDDGTAFK